MKKAKFKENIKLLANKNIVYVDEVGFNEFYAREFAYSKIGTPVDGEISGRKFSRTNLVAGYHKNRLVGKMLYNENTTSALFENWFKEILLPEIPRKSIIVLDNATFHNRNKLRKIALKKKCRAVFLPPYSPELNDIEQQWAIRKRKLKKNASAHPTFFNALLFNL